MLNFEEGKVAREKTSYRQVKSQRSPLYTEEGTKEGVELILSGFKDDNRIEWRKDNKVNILSTEIIPHDHRLVDQTRERRRKRLYEEGFRPLDTRREGTVRRHIEVRAKADERGACIQSPSGNHRCHQNVAGDAG